MELQKQIGELANDFENGSSVIAKKGLQLFVDALNSSDLNSEYRIKKLKEEIINAKPSMSALKNIINQAYELYQQGLVADSIKKYLLDKMNDETMRCIDLAKQKIFEMNFPVILTCSFSSTVLKLFESLKKDSYSFQVYAYKSIWRNRDYSEQMIDACKKMGIESKQIESKDLNDNLPSIGIIGADSQIPDKGVVNGVPSLEFAKLLKSKKIGLYVIAESFKKSDEVHIADGFEFVESYLISRIFFD